MHPNFEPPARKSIKPPTPRERAFGLTSNFARRLDDWVSGREREGKPHNPHARERLEAAAMILDEMRERLAKLLGDE
jgi:hypothetical protein